MRTFSASDRVVRTFLLLAILIAAPAALQAQGCSMCRDTTAGSAPQVRAGLRRAIPVLAIPAILLFIGFLTIARCSERWQAHEDGANK